MKYIQIIGIWSGAFLLLAGCNSEPTPHTEVPPEQQTPVKHEIEIPWEAQPEAPERPEGFELRKRALFHTDTQTEEFRFPVRGHKDFAFVGRLDDRLGRRSIHLETPQGLEEVAPTDWYMPPTGAMNARGDILICYNRLSGKTTRLTEGMMPDPTQGVEAYCRLRSDDKWQRGFRAGSISRVASWIKSVTALPSAAFRLEYQVDDGWLFDLDPRHAVMTQTIVNGIIEETRYIRPLIEDTP